MVDTRRFNLCRALRAADFSLEDCRELLTDLFGPESRALLHRQAEAMRQREVLARLTARQLERMEQDYAELEQRMDRMEILTLPAVWMLTVARCETPVADRALEEEKQQWLECLPLVRWVSRIPRSTMEQFGQGRVAYSSGLMIQAEDAEALGFVPSERVQLLPGGRLLSTVWRQTGRGPLTGIPCAGLWPGCGTKASKPMATASAPSLPPGSTKRARSKIIIIWESGWDLRNIKGRSAEERSFFSRRLYDINKFFTILWSDCRCWSDCR